MDVSIIVAALSFVALIVTWAVAPNNQGTHAASPARAAASNVPA
jgi:hypothetical protein